MNQENIDNSIKNSVLDKIKKDEVKMTPRQFFFMKWLTLSVTSLFFLVLGMYLLVYVAFLFVDNGLMYIPLFTESGLSDFIVEIPWTLVSLGLISIFLFSVTSKTFYRIYRKPFLFFFFSILFLIILSQIVFVSSGGMQYLKEEAYKQNLKLVPQKFLQFRDSQTGDLFVGYVVSTTTNSLIIRDRKNNLVELVSENALDLNTFLPGQLVNAYGKKDSGKVYIKSIDIIE